MIHYYFQNSITVRERGGYYKGLTSSKLSWMKHKERTISASTKEGWKKKLENDSTSKFPKFLPQKLFCVKKFSLNPIVISGKHTKSLEDHCL